MSRQDISDIGDRFESQQKSDIVVADTTTTLPTIADPLLKKYILDIQKYKMLSHEEEFDLANDYHSHCNIISANKLVTSHLRLVVRVAFDYRGYGLPVMDLISEGNLGLIHAVKKFNPSMGYRLSTYAIWWIKAAIQEFILRSWSIVRIGTTAMQRTLFFSLQKIKENISSYGSILDVGTKNVSQMNSLQRDISHMEMRMLSRDASMSDVNASGTAIEDSMESNIQTPEDIVCNKMDREMKFKAISNAMSILSDREIEILKVRVLCDDGQKSTLDKLSKKFGVSKERIRQIAENAMEKIKKHCNS